MILSILIATMPERKDMFDRLLFEVRSQVSRSGIDIEILADNGIGSIGAKRQRMIEAAQGDYICFIDDDDEIMTDYLSCILTALESKPDAVGFKGWTTTDGRKPKDFYISRVYDRYHEKNSVYYRFNNHLSPVRRDISIAAGFTDMGFGEDTDYAVRMRPLIKTEVFIDRKLYHYKYVSKK
jgi:glycosyltransferase involved in cell wall biosynthesis